MANGEESFSGLFPSNILCFRLMQRGSLSHHHSFLFLSSKGLEENLPYRCRPTEFQCPAVAS
ncbi:hypothetical protein AXX17_ATUG03750 (mitochondrion) [Arabidopsis thaliana]|uniref:Uncharacterized protein n=1 Tax=Arabidopsis thaliana TaxID=3702 RepID=A0A178U6A1_ARATH|nr:hypothetical protein AXX17_ATUG03750 [Arabidopsis thaliana]